MTEDMEKRWEKEIKECAYMKYLNDGEFLHELSWNNYYVFNRMNKIIYRLSAIDTLKEENKELELKMKAVEGTRESFERIVHANSDSYIKQLEAKLKEAYRMAVEINVREITHERFEPLLELLTPDDQKSIKGEQDD